MPVCLLLPLCVFLYCRYCLRQLCQFVLLTSWRRAKEWWAHYLAGSNIGVRCLEVIMMFTLKCPHAETASREAGSYIYVCSICHRDIPSERAKPVTEGEMKGERWSVRSCLSEELNFSRWAHHRCWLNISWADSIQHYSSSAINMFQWQSKTL